jgi:hypothetical protein
MSVDIDVGALTATGAVRNVNDASAMWAVANVINAQNPFDTEMDMSEALTRR